MDAKLVERREGDEYEVQLLESITQISRQRWNGLTERSSLGSVFHRYGWLQAIEAGTELEPLHLVVMKDTNPVGAMPHFISDILKVPARRLASLKPAFGGPIISTDEEQVLDILLSETAELCRGDIITHLIRVADPGFVRYNDYLIDAGYTVTISNSRLVIDLSDGWEDIRARMSGSRRRGLKKGEENEATVREEEATEENLRAFYPEYLAVMDRVGEDGYPEALFAELTTMADRILIAAATVDGQPAGKHLYLLDDEQSTIHHFFGGVREEYFEYHSSEIIHKHMIQWGIRNGYSSFDFGSTPSDFRDGLFAYKEGFGADIVPTLAWERGAGFSGALFQTGRSVYQRTTTAWDGFRE